MVKAWVMTEGEDLTQPLQKNPNEEVTLEQLGKLGLMYFHMDGPEDPAFHQLCLDRHYTYQDQVTLSVEKTPNLEALLARFVTEHLHDDEEIRFCVDGSGYFDVRGSSDEWIRVHVTKGDLLILPAGVYHRFTLDTDRYIIAKRMFQGEQVWTAYDRPQDDRPTRVAYLQTIKA